MDGFIRANEQVLARLDCRVDVALGARRHRTAHQILGGPGGHTGAPFRSAQGQSVAGGLVIRSRFRMGLGEIPPWALARPVIGRLAELLRTAKRGYRDKAENLKRPRGRILWAEYTSEQMLRGKWDTLPCRYSDLATDPKLRRSVRWGLERVRADLMSVGGRDILAMHLAHESMRLLASISEPPLFPARQELESSLGRKDFLIDVAIARGLEALGWLVDERGLGGGRELHGLAWTLKLDQLWELCVAAHVSGLARHTGGQLYLGHKGQTVFPLQWTDPGLRSLGHLTPDLVLRRHDELRVFDAKYKAHFAELDEAGWQRIAEDVRDSHGAPASPGAPRQPECGAWLEWPSRLPGLNGSRLNLRLAGRQRVQGSTHLPAHVRRTNRAL